MVSCIQTGANCRRWQPAPAKRRTAEFPVRPQIEAKGDVPGPGPGAAVMTAACLSERGIGRGGLDPLASFGPRPVPQLGRAVRFRHCRSSRRLRARARGTRPPP